MMMMPLPMAASPRIPEEEDTVVAVAIRRVHAMVVSPCLPEEEEDTMMPVAIGHIHAPSGVVVILEMVVPPPNVLRPPPTITDMTIDVIAKRTVDK